MKRAYYFARRIPIHATPNEILTITPQMAPREIHDLYVGKSTSYDSHIHNGPWILRPIVAEGIFYENTFPPALTPYNIWEMVGRKIEQSHVLVAIVNPKSYGAIVEVGYAVGLGTVAVYVLPDKELTHEERQDLWLVLQASIQTQALWKDEDIVNAAAFREYNIFTIGEYLDFVTAIIPNFLSKR